MRRREFLGTFGAGLALGLPAFGLPFRRWSPRAELRLIERWSWAMGQAVHLRLFAESDDQGLEAAAAALGELRRVEDRLTRFDDASDLSELNRTAGRRPLLVDQDLGAVLRLAARLRRLTGGAFDIAVEPLMRAWGFREARKAPPGAREIAEARQAVEAAIVVLEGRRAFLPSAHTQLDLGGIGVGYGLDRCAKVLRDHRIVHAFIDISGDCLGMGAPPGEAGWWVGIAHPTRKDHLIGSTRLRDRALATSANTVSAIRYGSMLRGHVMDPHTGWPATALRQAAVLARSGVAADALSTAMLVAGVPAPGVEQFWEVKSVEG